MAAPRKRPADLTGKRDAALKAEHQEEIAARAAEISLMATQKQVENKEVVDLTQPEPSAPIQAKVEVKSPTTTIRVNTAIEDMTFGRERYEKEVVDEDGTVRVEVRNGPLRNYTFEEGRTYKVPTDVAEHLEELEYLWH